MKILIAEDEVLLALTMEAALLDAGHEVTGVARDPSTAFDLARATRPDIALIDLHLARGTSGADVARHLRQQHGIPAIFVSANPRDCKKVGYSIGVMGCLSKPFSGEELIEAVDAAAMVLQQQNPERLPNNLEFYYVL